MKLMFFKTLHDLTHRDVMKARIYIAEYWPKLLRHHPKDDESLVGLPHPYLVPAYEEGHDFDFNELYYWDCYFTIQGFLDKEHKELVLGILDDLIYLFERFKIIPNASRVYLTGRSQPPLLTSMIWDIYEAYNMDEAWLKSKIEVAMMEYRIVWMGTAKPNARCVYQGLSRYYDINLLHDLAEAESGWDMTPRFNRKCLNYLPADLNALLYKYEMDFARYYRLIDDAEGAESWENVANQRKATMDKLMWSEIMGIYYDYNYVKKQRGIVSSLAGFYPLWAGMVDQKKAKKMMKALKRFENKGGLATTDVPQINKLMPGAIPTQWAYPNGWAPLHFLIIKGLQRYGYQAEAKQIAMKWLRTNLTWFNKHGVFLERYNVVTPDKPPAKGVYPSPPGFGWTNGVFEHFCKEFIDSPHSK